MKIRLQVRPTGNATGTTWEHAGPVIRLGRNPACELAFTGEGCPTVSWEHARLDLGADGLFARDLGSSNGTYVNGQPIKQRTALKVGDRLGLGQTGPRLLVLEIHLPDRPDAGDKGGATVAVPSGAPAALAVRAAPRTGAALVPPPAPLPDRVAGPAAALQGNGRPVAVALPAPALPAPALPAAAPPGHTRLLLDALQHRNRRMWALLAFCAVCLLAVIGLAFYFLHKESLRNAEEIARTRAEAHEAEEKLRLAEKARREAEDRARKEADERNKNARERPLSGEEIYQRTLRSTVYVAVRHANGMRANGSGALVDRRRGLVLTAYHVVDKAAEVGVIFPSYNGERVIADRAYYTTRLGSVLVRGEVVATNPRTDLAVIRLAAVPGDAPELPLAALSPLPGSRVHTVGNPGSSAGLWAYTVGAVRQVARRQYTFASKQAIDAFVVETQNPINKGDSGGPVVSDRAELVAVNSGTAGTNLRDGTLCIDVREVRALLATVRP